MRRSAMASTAVLEILAFGGLHGVPEHDARSQESERDEQRGDDQPRHRRGEADSEGDHEQGHREGEHEITDTVGEQGPFGHLCAATPNGVVGMRLGRMAAHKVLHMVRVEQRDDVGDGVLLVTLDRPERRNAVDHATLLGLLDAQAAAAEARVVVLTGAAPAFSAGADLSGVREDVFAADLRRVLEGFTTLTCPVMAAIDGPALGAGAQLAAVADLRVATAESIIGVPAARLGLVIDRWTVSRFVHEFGWPITRGMLLAAETYRGDRLHAAGPVHRLGDLEVALAWASQIARLAPLSISGHKLALESLPPDHPDAPHVTNARETAWASDDAHEGRQAFLEKRPPKFTGR